MRKKIVWQICVIAENISELLSIHFTRNIYKSNNELQSIIKLTSEV